MDVSCIASAVLDDLVVVASFEPNERLPKEEQIPLLHLRRRPSAFRGGLRGARLRLYRRRKSSRMRPMGTVIG